MARLLQFKCDNKKCECFNKEIDLWVDETEGHKCECCGEELRRVFGFSGMIKTGDGIKS